MEYMVTRGVEQLSSIHRIHGLHQSESWRFDIY